MEQETITLNRKELLELRARYAQKQAEGERLQEQTRERLAAATTEKERDNQRIILDMYVYQTGKEAGFKEGIDELFYKVDGVFPQHEKAVA